MATVLVACTGVGVEGAGGLVKSGCCEYQGFAGQVVKERCGLVEEQGQVVLDPRRCNAVGDVLVDRGVFIGMGKLLKPPVTEP